MTTPTAPSKTIAIIGGGVSGTLTAFHLMRRRVPAQVIMIDQRPDFGLGLAYSTPSLRHLLNVPAGKISALPDQPHHFLDWLRDNYDPSATPTMFAPRAVFGRYMRSILATISGLQQEVATVTEVQPGESGAVLTLSNGQNIHAELVVLATGNFEPSGSPGISSDAVAGGLYHHNAWSEETYKGLRPNARVAIVGTGLTAVDVVLRLRELGHTGKIIAVSRHGVFPNRHEDYAPLSTSAIPLSTSPTAAAYLRALRSAIASGTGWRAAVDSLRSTTNLLWGRLPLNEKKRFRRHLQRRWDVVRHRMAPPVADVIDTEIANGSLEIREGSLVAVELLSNGAQVTIGKHGVSEQLTVDRVINCTGPSMDYRRVPSSLLQNLFAQGVVTPGQLGTGFHCAENGAVIDACGRVSQVIFNLGPGRLGDLIESIAVPEIREQAVELAATLNTLLARSEDCTLGTLEQEAKGEQVAA